MGLKFGGKGWDQCPVSPWLKSDQNGIEIKMVGSPQTTLIG